MKPMHMALMLVVLTATVAPVFSVQAAEEPAAAFPSKPVRWVVGFAPGASNDVIARTVGARLSESLGQQFIIDNRTGAAGLIGGEIVARSVPDGYTLPARGAGYILVRHRHPHHPRAVQGRRSRAHRYCQRPD